MPNFKNYDQRQSVFRQLVPNQLLDDEHPARVVDAVVEQLDLSSIYAWYGREGNPAYHPKMMLKVLFYSYLIGVMSSRKMEESLALRADYIFLSGDQVPDFRTLNAFRTRHIKELSGLFTQIVTLCRTLGMVDFRHLAIDGQKIHAHANYRKTVDRTRAKRQLERIQTGMEKLLKAEPADSGSGEKVEAQRRTLARKEQKLKDALAFLESMKESASVNMEDAEAKSMKHKDGRSLPSYNHQSAVDSTFGVTCAVATTQSGDCPQDLFPLVDAATENAGACFETVLADSGFCDYQRLQEMEQQREEEFLVPDRRMEESDSGETTSRGVYDKRLFTVTDEGRSMICPQGRAMKIIAEVLHEDGHRERTFGGVGCAGCEKRDQCTKSKSRGRQVLYDSREPFRELMRERLRRDEGRQAYRKRQAVVEPVHGHDQKNLGWRQHLLRGLQKASLEFLLVRLAGNIGKIARYRAKKILTVQGL